MRRPIALFAVAAALSLALGAASASAVAPDPNPWLAKRFLNIAHQGGEDEAPSNTMFAFKSAVASRGADMLELDVQLTSDGELVVIHDDTVTRTTDGPTARPDSQVRVMTLAQVQALDAGYWFRPGSYSHDSGIPAEQFIYRGVRTGAKPPPAGFTADDFRIPTLREVLDSFPTTPINIEIKMPKICDGGLECDNPALGIPTAQALAALLDQPAYSGRTDLIVVSFSDTLLQVFNLLDAAPKVALAPGIAGVAATPSPACHRSRTSPRSRCPRTRTGSPFPRCCSLPHPPARTPTGTATRSTSGRTGPSPTVRPATPA